MTRDRKLAYRVEDDIPVLLVEDGIALGQIADFPAAATELTRLAARKEIVFDEEILVGLEQAPLALASLYQGANRGKLIVSLVG